MHRIHSHQKLAGESFVAASVASFCNMRVVDRRFPTQKVVDFDGGGIVFDLAFRAIDAAAAFADFLSECSGGRLVSI
jgi:hypothetical protein